MKRLRNLMRLFSATRNFSLMKLGAWSLRLLSLLLFCFAAMFVALPSEAAIPHRQESIILVGFQLQQDSFIP